MSSSCANQSLHSRCLSADFDTMSDTPRYVIVVCLAMCPHWNRVRGRRPPRQLFKRTHLTRPKQSHTDPKQSNHVRAKCSLIQKQSNHLQAQKVKSYCHLQIQSPVRPCLRSIRWDHLLASAHVCRVRVDYVILDMEAEPERCLCRVKPICRQLLSCG
jgi:hypothetical protein